MDNLEKLLKLQNEIEQKAWSQGLFLYRFHRDFGRFGFYVTYAIHNSEQKPRKNSHCSGYSVTFTNKEALTESHKVYEKFEKMYDSLNQQAA